LEQAVVKRTISVAAVFIMIMAAGQLQAAVSIVGNGSFEDDGRIDNIATESPRRWCDVNLPTGFYGWVKNDWASHGYEEGDGNSLTFRWYDNKANANYTATVSQQVYLGDVTEIIFDIRLDTDWWPDISWDENKCSAMVLLDGNSIWDSSVLEPNETVCVFQNNRINDININDENLHTLTLAMEVNITGGTPWYIYYCARFDFVKFDTHCGGLGYLPEDLNCDCYVDMNDLGLFLTQWLTEQPDYKYDFFEDESDIIDMYDFGVFAEGWHTCSDWQKWGTDSCYEAELLSADISDDGIVDFGDLQRIGAQWLWEGTPGTVTEDIFKDGIVDLADFAVLAKQWQMKSWMYRVSN
jgi:hypothetical protein